MKKILSSDSRLVISLFILWKLTIFLALFIGVSIVPLTGSNFLGGRIDRYNQNPFLFAFANFDGEHYLSIAQFGYHNLEHFFFPVYPMLMNIFTKPFEQNIASFTVVGLFISNIAFLLALFVFWKLTKLDYSSNIAVVSLVMLLVFPTSFYFSAVYSESIFLLLALLSFYFARRKNWFLASLFGLISSATRIFGILLLPTLILEAWQQKESFKKSFWLIFIPFGLLIYMYYQWVTVSDPLAFYRQLQIFGPQRGQEIILLPQIYFRYIKILLLSNVSNPIYQINILEFFVGILFFILPIYGFFKKIRFSYIFYSLAGFLFATIPGSFSSLPRYVLALFPSFVILAIFIIQLPKFFRLLIFLVSIICLVLEAILFLRGYWVA